MQRNTYLFKRGAATAFLLAFLFLTLSASAQTSERGGQISGAVKDPVQDAITGAEVTLTSRQMKIRRSAVTDIQGVYTFPSLRPGAYVVSVNAAGFRSGTSSEINITERQSVEFNFNLTLAGVSNSVNVSAGSVETAYHVDRVAPGGPLGTTPILNLPYDVNVISRQLIDDTQSRNFAEVAKYMPPAYPFGSSRAPK